MIRWLRRLLGRGEEEVPESEQCYLPGCSNRRRGPGVYDADKCDECSRETRRMVDARLDVRLGEAQAVYEIRCFGCEHVDVNSWNGPGVPAAICPECKSDQVDVVEIDPKIGGGAIGR